MAERERKARWRRKNPNYMQEYRAKNLDKVREKDRAYGKTEAGRSSNNRASRKRYEKSPEYWQDYYQQQKLRPDQSEIVRNYSLRKYGLNSDQKRAMMAAQDNRCAIGPCGYEFKDISDASVDHCHRSGKVRALLCNRCNTALGQVRDNPDRLRSLADYLDTHTGGALSG